MINPMILEIPPSELDPRKIGIQYNKYLKNLDTTTLLRIFALKVSSFSFISSFKCVRVAHLDEKFNLKITCKILKRCNHTIKRLKVGSATLNWKLLNFSKSLERLSYPISQKGILKIVKQNSRSIEYINCTNRNVNSLHHLEVIQNMQKDMRRLPNLKNICIVVMNLKEYEALALKQLSNYPSHSFYIHLFIQIPNSMSQIPDINSKNIMVTTTFQKLNERIKDKVFCSSFVGLTLLITADSAQVPLFSYIQNFKNLEWLHLELNFKSISKLDSFDLIQSLKFPKKLKCLAFEMISLTLPNEELAKVSRPINSLSSFNQTRNLLNIFDQISKLTVLQELQLKFAQNNVSTEDIYGLMMMYGIVARCPDTLKKLSLELNTRDNRNHQSEPINLDFLLKIIPTLNKLQKLQLTSDVFVHNLTTIWIDLSSLRVLSIFVIKDLNPSNENISRTFHVLSLLRCLEELTISDRNRSLDEHSLSHFNNKDAFPSLRHLSLLSLTQKLNSKIIHELIVSLALRKIKYLMLILTKTTFPIEMIHSAVELFRLIPTSGLVTQTFIIQKSGIVDLPVVKHLDTGPQ